MAIQSLFGLAAYSVQVERIVNELKSANFSNQDISVLFPDNQTTQTFAHDKQTKAPKGALAGASTGGVVGGALGWMTGLGALAIPGVGPFIAAGPIIAALSGVAGGATLGGIAGALIGLGMSEVEAKRYADEVKKGKILISVQSENSGEISTAKEIFVEAGAQDITTTGVPSVKRLKATHDPEEGHVQRASGFNWAPTGDPVGFAAKSS